MFYYDNVVCICDEFFFHYVFYKKMYVLVNTKHNFKNGTHRRVYYSET